MDPLAFAEDVLGGRDSVKGFRVTATDGDAGRVTWASYEPGESYLVVSLSRLGRKHHVVPAGAVTGVGDGEVRVGLSRAQIRQLPGVPQPGAAPSAQTWEQTMAAFERAYADSLRF
jgi:hypothetical protein